MRRVSLAAVFAIVGALALGCDTDDGGPGTGTGTTGSTTGGGEDGGNSDALADVTPDDIGDTGVAPDPGTGGGDSDGTGGDDGIDGPDGTDVVDVPDVADAGDGGGGGEVDSPDTFVPGCADTGKPCPGGDCDFCPLTAKACTTAQLDACVAETVQLAATAAIPEIGGVPNLPACMEPTCLEGRCSLRSIPSCCQVLADCPTDGAACIQYQCTPETNPPAHLANTAYGYCTVTTAAGCCSGEQNTLALSQTFGSFPNLPVGWQQVDLTKLPNDPEDVVGWWVRSGEPKCKSGGDCVHLGRRKVDDQQVETDYCFSYFNGDVIFQPGEPGCVPAAGGVANDTNEINVKLQTAQVALSKSDRPWVLTFWLRMNTEAPAAGYVGDNLTVVVTAGGKERKVFDSVTINNTTKDQPDRWRRVAVDLTRWHGQNVGIEWRFQTHGFTNQYEDPINGVFEGVFLDDVRVQTTCAAENAACTGPGGCAAPTGCADTACAVFEKKTKLSTEPKAGFCQVTPLADCTVCADAGECPAKAGFKAACTAGKCTYQALQCTPQNITQEPLDQPTLPVGWTTQDDASCKNFWTMTDNRSDSGTRSLYFGHADKLCGAAVTPVCDGAKAGKCPTFQCDNSSIGTLGTVTTGSMTLPAAATLLAKFRLFLSTGFDTFPVTADYVELCEQFQVCQDRLTIYAVEGDSEQEVWDSYGLGGTTDCGWKPVTVNLTPLAGKTIKLKFVFDSTDEIDNGFEGVYIDSLSVDAVCLDKAPCSFDSDCQALAPDECNVGQCTDGVCSFTKDPGCCISDLDCQEKAEGCTVGKCGLDHACSFALSESASCCESGAVYWTEAFDGGQLPTGWKVTTNAPVQAAWQWMASEGKDGSGGLYFGDPATMTYAVAGSRVLGWIDSPPIVLPPGGIPTAAFDLKLSTEFDDYTAEDFDAYLDTIGFFNVDRLAVYVSVDGGQTFAPDPAWRSEDGVPLKGTTKDPDGNLVWQDLAVDLGAYKGQSVVLRFEFDSVDGQVNTYGGAWIDNIRIRHACSTAQIPSPCIADAYCEDGDGCTLNHCQAGKCASANDENKPGCCFAAPISTFGFDGAMPGWTVTNGTTDAKVTWQTSPIDKTGGSQSLWCGNAALGNYSGCQCAAADACLGTTCPEASCVTPSSVVRSPSFTLEPTKDYHLQFDLKADLEVSEGSVGALEEFEVRLMTQTPGGPAQVGKLVCHSNACSTGNPCTSGVNFQFPGCPQGDPGDYGKWLHYEFNLSDTLCGLQGSVAETMVATLLSGTPQTFWIEASFKTGDNFSNCGTGLFIDELQFALLCNEWTSCQ